MLEGPLIGNIQCVGRVFFGLQQYLVKLTWFDRILSVRQPMSDKSVIPCFDVSQRWRSCCRSYEMTILVATRLKIR